MRLMRFLRQLMCSHKARRYTGWNAYPINQEEVLPEVHFECPTCGKKWTRVLSHYAHMQWQQHEQQEVKK